MTAIDEILDQLIKKARQIEGDMLDIAINDYVVKKQNHQKLINLNQSMMRSIEYSYKIISKSEN